MGEGRHRERALHPRPGVQAEYRHAEEATGDEVRPDVVLPS